MFFNINSFLQNNLHCNIPLRSDFPEIANLSDFFKYSKNYNGPKS